MNYLKRLNKKENYKFDSKTDNAEIFNKYKEDVIEILKQYYKPSSKEMGTIITQLPNTIVEIEYTNRNVDYSWDAYIANIHLYVKKEFLNVFKKNSNKIFEAAERVFNGSTKYIDTLVFKNNMLYRLKEIIITEDIKNDNEIFEISKNAKTDTLILALNDANKFIEDKNYTSALDRIHTFFMGYIRKDLNIKNISYTENETLNQLFKKLYAFYESEKSLDKKIGTILKSMTGTISSINDLRNKNSLSHPNEIIVNHRDAKLAIEAVRVIINYLDTLNS